MNRPRTTGLTRMSAFLCGTATGVLAQEEAHLLDPAREGDAPLPLYKNLSEILSENWWGFAVGGGIALVVAFWWWFRRHLQKDDGKEVEPPPRDPYEEAMEALEALVAERHRMEAKPFAFRLSEVLRVYVERCFAVPAMELTGEEFLREVAEHKFFRNHYDDLLREFIDRSDMVKYSREGIDGEGLSLLLESAMHFVKDSHRRLEQERTRTESQPREEAA